MLATANPPEKSRLTSSSTLSRSERADEQGRGADDVRVAARIAVELVRREVEGLDEDGREPDEPARPELGPPKPVPGGENRDSRETPEAGHCHVAPLKGFLEVSGANPLGQTEQAE